MITVRAERRPDGVALSMDGHADYSPGNDIVCAGASAIVYTFLGWLANHPGDAVCEEQLVESGRVRLAAQGGELLDIVFEATVIGLLQLEKQYPAHVKVDYKTF